MTQANEQLQQLLNRLDELVQRQNAVSKEIREIQDEVQALKKSLEETTPEVAADPAIKENELSPDTITLVEDKAVLTEAIPNPQKSVPKSSKKEKKFKRPSDWERLIGENLISKIGIIITIIGAAIGAKYSIDNNLISPLTRIILGYSLGLGLLVTGIRLKAKYDKFSAVLVSGAMAILYFITFFAYDLYGLIPQAAAFSLMLIFTFFTVFIAQKYNHQIIAHIGLVGAYGVPFLLGNNSGNVVILYIYMAIINIGILVLAFKKYWKSLHYTALGFTWFIFLFSYSSNNQDGLMLGFATLFFLIFYLTLLFYKFKKRETFNRSDIALILLNSFVYFGIGLDLVSGTDVGARLLGLFALANALLHFGVGYFIHRHQLTDQKLKLLILGLVLIFITLAILIQLDGNWVTIIWVGEAAVLFWIGRTKAIGFYEKSGYLLIVLSLISLIQDWWYEYSNYNYYLNDPKLLFLPFFNVYFLSSLLVVLAIGIITKIAGKEEYPSVFVKKKDLNKLIYFALPTLFLAITYFSIFLEIRHSGAYLFNMNSGKNGINRESPLLQEPVTLIWIIDYSLLFATGLIFLYLKKLKKGIHGQIFFWLGLVGLFLFIILGINGLQNLSIGINSIKSPIFFYQTTGFYYLLKYLSYFIVAVTLWTCFRMRKEVGYTKIHSGVFNVIFMLILLSISSEELVSLLSDFGSPSADKLGLSILWGIFAFILVAYGIWKSNKFFRISAICLFGITLLKLFFYDISYLNTISKTIVFVSLGLILLVVSFLYNKYKNLFENEKKGN